jgi:hypothetical protein
MNDVLTLIRNDLSREQVKRDQIRADFPGCTQIIDDLRAVFGPGVKPKYFSEGGKTMGRELEFAGTDVDQVIRLANADAKRRGR